MNPLLDPIIQNRLEKLSETFNKRNIPAKTVLLEEGNVSQNIYYIVKGAIRLFFYKDGKDITFQFFLDGSFVASFDSFFEETPSLFYMETIEDCEVVKFDKSDFLDFLGADLSAHKWLENFMAWRFHVYQQLFLSRIKNTPKERYEELRKNNPEIVNRIPQHYIASYLGITPVSLSRIRNRR